MLKPLTDEQRRAYVNAPKGCPYCGQNNVSRDVMDIDPTSLEMSNACLNASCRREWSDIYTLTGIEEDLSTPPVEPPLVASGDIQRYAEIVADLTWLAMVEGLYPKLYGGSRDMIYDLRTWAIEFHVEWESGARGHDDYIEQVEAFFKKKVQDKFPQATWLFGEDRKEAR